MRGISKMITDSGHLNMALRLKELLKFITQILYLEANHWNTVSSSQDLESVIGESVRDCNFFRLCPCVRCLFRNALCAMCDVCLKGSVPGRLQSI